MENCHRYSRSPEDARPQSQGGLRAAGPGQAVRCNQAGRATQPQAGQATQPSGLGQPARCARRAGFHQRGKADGPGHLARWRRRAGSTRPGTRGEAQWFSGRGGNWIGQVTKWNAEARKKWDCRRNYWIDFLVFMIKINDQSPCHGLILLSRNQALQENVAYSLSYICSR